MAFWQPEEIVAVGVHNTRTSSSATGQLQPTIQSRWADAAWSRHE